MGVGGGVCNIFSTGIGVPIGTTTGTIPLIHNGVHTGMGVVPMWYRPGANDGLRRNEDASKILSSDAACPICDQVLSKRYTQIMLTTNDMAQCSLDLFLAEMLFDNHQLVMLSVSREPIGSRNFTFTAFYETLKLTLKVTWAGVVAFLLKTSWIFANQIAFFSPNFLHMITADGYGWHFSTDTYP
ncbi:hypothetical protein OSB04_005939 [Centaurea solstitialis]|uniref:Uncharacterized protein n=1 Tax=Centaurea solstitialis TaxID=347529 RepID=A0AA38WRQ9_9ASTR|nr:hypothetical protein OSB04_005939 [Centaurea solstitialis]